MLETNLSNANNAVWLAYEITAERDVVLKFVKDRKAAVRERILMVDTDHPNIAKLLSTFTYEGCTTLVLEYKPGNNLLQLWEHLDRKTGLSILTDVASALSAIHAKGLWHGDVSHLNVIYSEEKKRAYLVDFSFEGKCAPGFHSPEDFEDSPHEVNSKTDVFRFGILIDLLRPDLKSKFLDCLHPAPDHRPSIDEVLQRIQKHKTLKKSRIITMAAALVSGLFVTGIYLDPLFKQVPDSQQLSQSQVENKTREDSKAPKYTRILASYSNSRGHQSATTGRIQHILSDEP